MQLSNKKVLVCEYMICFVTMMLCSVFHVFPVASYISVIAACCFFYMIYRYNTTFYLKYLAVFFAAASMIVAVWIIEFGSVYLDELKTKSQFAGSLPGIILSYCTTIIIIIIGDVGCRSRTGNIRRMTFTKDSSSEDKLPQYMLMITFWTDVLFVVLWLYVIRTPSFLMNMNKSEYFDKYLMNMPSILIKLNSFSSIFVFFPILCLIKRHIILGLTGTGSYLLYCLWTGNKFGSFFWVLCIFLIVLYPRLTTKKKRIVKNAIIIGVLIICACIVGAVVIQTYYITTAGNTIEYALFRIAAQGQLWWKSFLQFQGSMHISEFGDEIKGVLYGSSNVTTAYNNFGIYKMMFLCAPRSIVDAYLESGSRFTEAGFAVAYYYLGIFGAILFAVVMGFIATRLVNAIVQMINEERYIRAVILLRLYMIWRTSLSMFTFYDWIGPLSILSYFVLIMSHRRPYILKLGEHKVFVL